MLVYTLTELAEHMTAHGVAVTVWGNASLPVVGVNHPKLAQQPDELVLVLSPDALTLVGPTIKTALVPSGVELPGPSGLKGALLVDNPRLALVPLLTLFEVMPRHHVGIHPSAVVEPTASVDPTASIGPLCYVGAYAVIGPNAILLPQVTVMANAHVGEGCLLHPGVRVGERVIIGKRVIIHHNASLGADGFSFVTPQPSSIDTARQFGKVTAQNTTLIRIPSIGTVMVEDDVEIGACTTIDRANVGATIIRQGTKLDNLVMIGHNNTVGQNCLIAGQVGVAGSCQVGNRVVMAGQVGIADHLTIGDDSILMAQAGVNKDVNPKTVMLGAPAVPWRQAAEQFAAVAKLKDLRQDVRQLKQQLAALEKTLDASNLTAGVS
jgi:UDP-3-O-[3-hydroxymyristoyl] glucosamine N-acyltransferase